MQNDDPAISDVFRRGIERLAGIDEQSNKEIDRIREDSKRLKMDVVRDIAKELEKEFEAKGLSITDIPQEIVAGLQGKVSQSLIYEALDDKYKNQEKAKHRRGKIKNPVPMAEQTDDEQKQPIEMLADDSPAQPGGVVPSGALGGANLTRQITMDGFLPTVDKLINSAIEQDDHYIIEKQVFRDFIRERAKL